VPVPATAPKAASTTVATGAAAPVELAAVDRQDLQPARRAARGGKKIVVQRGDTLMNLAAREYGYATYTVLDIVRAANPGIQDLNRIIAGSEIVFPDPGPSTRVRDDGDDVSVLVATTPILVQAQEFQRMAGSRYRLPADLEPIALGEGRNLYRVSVRQVPDKQQAHQIADSLGTILKDPS
jgi:phage tail protein X